MKILLLLTLFGINQAEFEYDEGVLVLNTENFEEAVKTFDYLLAEFYAPWCGHCKQLAPEYSQAAQAIAENSNSDFTVALAKIDATENEKLAEKYEISGYPTLKFFRKQDGPDAPVDFTGGRNAESIQAWVEKKSGPATAELEDLSSAIKFKKQNAEGLYVVGYFPEGQDSSPLVMTAWSLDEAAFGITSKKEIADFFELENPGDIKLFKNFDEGSNIYNSENDGSIAEFINNNSLPYVTTFSDKTAAKIFGGSIKYHVLFFSSSETEGDNVDINHEGNHAHFTAAAKKLKGQALFVYIDSSVTNNLRIMDFFGIKTPESQVPTFRMVHLGQDVEKFKPADGEEQDISADKVEKFVQGVLDETIERHYMSEEIVSAEEQDESGEYSTYYLVAKNYEEIVYDQNKHVFVEFYAPWCGHCQQLAPEWEKLGQHFKDRDDVLIARSDATANEFKGIKISGFPTIKWFPKGEEREMINYNGGRTLEEFIEFVENDGVMPKEDPETEDVDEGEEEINADEDHDEL